MDKDNNIEFTSSNHGFAFYDKGVLTFNIEGVEDRDDIRKSEYHNLYKKYMSENFSVNIDGYWVPMWGEGHNLYPQEVQSIVSENKSLPGIIKKMIDFLFGKGPYLYKETISADGKKIRVPVQNPKIQAWLDSWEDNGHPSYIEYLRCLINDYYLVKTCNSQYHFTKARRVGEKNSVLALSYVGSDEARLAALGDFTFKRVKQEDCKYVLVGDWFIRSGKSYSVYNRFDPNNPLKYPHPIAFNSEKTFGKWVYAYNDWFKGLYEWIKASNLTPKYLSSYLKNALNAHVHCKIPATWYNFQKGILQQICQQNIVAINPVDITPFYKGVHLVDKDGKAFRFTESMMEALISEELKKITNLLSGEGENQGKLYATQKIGEDSWEFDEFPSKFKEYFESVISYDKRADQVVLAGIGISSSITNIENDGVISKSGSDVYYNYIIYIQTLTFPEYFVCKEINRAIRMNFPEAAAEGIKLGFNINVPDKQQDVTEKNRLPQQQPV